MFQEPIKPEPKTVKCYRIRPKGASKGKADIYTFRPDGKTLRSQREMQEYSTKNIITCDKDLVS